uniref:Acidic protein n=1 Tax=Oryza punctata TaxID=4537 RepID=A0A0E0LZA5_ORYPU
MTRAIVVVIVAAVFTTAVVLSTVEGQQPDCKSICNQSCASSCRSAPISACSTPCRVPDFQPSQVCGQCRYNVYHNIAPVYASSTVSPHACIGRWAGKR